MLLLPIMLLNPPWPKFIMILFLRWKRWVPLNITGEFFALLLWVLDPLSADSQLVENLPSLAEEGATRNALESPVGSPARNIKKKVRFRGDATTQSSHLSYPLLARRASFSFSSFLLFCTSPFGKKIPQRLLSIMSLAFHARGRTLAN